MDVSTTADERQETISPAIRFKFEELAFRICDEGKVDLYDRPYRIREWTIRMEELFRAKNADGKNTDENDALYAIEKFGPAENTIKTLRGGWKGLWHRLLYYERYTIQRLVALGSLCLLHDWIRTSSSVTYSVVRLHEIETTFIAPNADYYLGVLFLAVVAIPRWIRPRNPILKRIVLFGASLTVCWFYYTVFKQCLGSTRNLYHSFITGRWNQPDVDNIPLWKNAIAGVIWSGAQLFEIVALLVAVPVIISEIFALPRQRRKKIERRRRQIGMR
jgi:hypothetical protein